MPKISAGILIYRIKNNVLEVLLVHPGGPIWSKKDIGNWSIPKGEAEEKDADYSQTARREIKEELGIEINKNLFPLGTITQRSGKIVYAWAVEGNYDVSLVKSNTFQIEWPPKSGKMQQFPEIDKARYFSIGEAKEKINPAQKEFLEKLEELIKFKK